MKGKRFKEEQIIRLLQEAESGLAIADVCRKHNCSEQSFYRWKAKFGGMTALGGLSPEQFLRCWTEGNINQQPKSLTL